MHCIISGSDDPFFNLALEEILLKTAGDEEYIVIGANSTSVILGKHQSAHREVDSRFTYENNIPVIRRISGGGTVFHDKGNINFTFIRNCEEGKQIDFPRYTQPVLAYLTSLGLKPELSGSDIRLNGKKVSGNAEHVYRRRVLHHGTLLFSSDLYKMRDCIRKDYSSYSTRAVPSNPSAVMNLSNILTQFAGAEEFTSSFIDFLVSEFNADITVAGSKEISEAEKLAASKYCTWEWNYAYGPEYELVKEVKFRGHNLKCRLAVREGIISDFEVDGMNGLAETLLKGCRHMPDEILKVFTIAGITDVDIFDFF